MEKPRFTIAFVGQKGIPAQWGGVERATEELALRVARLGYHVLAYCRAWYTKSKPKNYGGVELIYTPSLHTKHLDTISHTWFSVWHALWNGVDVIHFQGIGPALLAWLPRLLRPRATVFVTFHCLDRRLQKWNWLARLFFYLGEWCAMNCAHEVFVTSRFLQDYCYEVWGRTTTYLPNGVFSDAHDVQSVRFLTAFDLEPYSYLVCVGRFMPDKAQHEVLEAFLRFKERAGVQAENIKLVFVGDGDKTDPYRSSLHEQAGGRADVIFAGTLTGARLKSIMSFARGAVQPSYSEGMPLAVLELAAYGVPLVLSDIPAHREIFGDIQNYVPVGDLARLSKNIEQIVKHYDIIRPVARAQAARIAEQYRWEVIAARYLVSLVAATRVPSHAALPQLLQKHFDVG